MKEVTHPASQAGSLFSISGSTPFWNQPSNVSQPWKGGRVRWSSLLVDYLRWLCSKASAQRRKEEVPAIGRLHANAIIPQTADSSNTEMYTYTENTFQTPFPTTAWHKPFLNIFSKNVSFALVLDSGFKWFCLIMFYLLKEGGKYLISSQNSLFPLREYQVWAIFFQFSSSFKALSSVNSN